MAFAATDRREGTTLGVAITSNPNAHVVREYGKYIPEFKCIALYTGCEVEDDSDRQVETMQCLATSS